MGDHSDLVVMEVVVEVVDLEEIVEMTAEMTDEEEDSRGLASFGWTREGEKSSSSDCSFCEV